MKLRIHTPAELQARQTRAAQAEQRAAALACLAETDWMVVRQAETGTPVPEDIRTRRAAARAQISALPRS